MKKKLLSLVMALLLSLSLLPLSALAAGMPFTDVPTGQWYYNDVKQAVESGLINGKTWNPIDALMEGAHMDYPTALRHLAARYHIWIDDEPVPTVKPAAPRKPVVQLPMIYWQPRDLVKPYMDLKKRHPDSVILFRSGDFYKALNSDAAKVSETLGIALIHPNDPNNGHLVAGFPHHALDAYLPKLIRAGMRVAIADPIQKKDIPQKEAVEADHKEAAAKKKETKKEPTKAKTEDKADTKSETKSEAKTEDKAKTVDMKPRAPQMVTVLCHLQQFAA